MRIRELINRTLDGKAGIAGAINAVVTGHVSGSDQRTSTSSRQRIVQRDGRTVVHESDVQTSTDARE